MILQQILNFIQLGCMYAVIAVGFTLYFGTTNLINFAHGDLCTVGAFFLLLIFTINGRAVNGINLGEFILSALLAVLLTVLLNLLLERFLFRKVRNRPPLEGLIISIALSMLLRELILQFYPNGGNPQNFPDPFRLATIRFMGLNLAFIQLFLLALCLLLALVFYWIVKRTQLGRTMRAIAQDSEAAKLIGLPVSRTIGWTFAIGAIFAAIAGIINGAIYGSVRYDMGVTLGVKGFVSAVIGGLDNPNGAFLGGMMLAFLETMVVAFFVGGSAFRDIIAFGVLMIVLLLRPEGLLGRKI